MTERLQWATRLLQSALPSELQTVALKVCLHADAAAFEDWRQRIGTTGEARYVLGGRTERLRRLLSLLYVRFQQSDVVLDKSLTTYLRTARAREQLRTESVRQICQDAITHLHDASVSPIVLKGMAVAETVYPEPSTRHCHDLDLLLPSAQMPAAATALIDAGYTLSSPPPGASNTSRWFSHPSAFQIGLHSSLYRIAAWNSDTTRVMGRSVPASIAGRSVRILSPHDALVHICCSGLAAGSRHSPCWAPDSWYLLQRAGDSFDWQALVADARASDRHPAILVGLQYLARKLCAPIPEGALHELRSIPPRRAGIDSMLGAALLSVWDSPLGMIRRAGNPADVARTAWWLLARPRESNEDPGNAQRA